MIVTTQVSGKQVPKPQVGLQVSSGAPTRLTAASEMPGQNPSQTPSDPASGGNHGVTLFEIMARHLFPLGQILTSVAKSTPKPTACTLPQCFFWETRPTSADGVYCSVFSH